MPNQKSGPKKSTKSVKKKAPSAARGRAKGGARKRRKKSGTRPLLIIAILVAAFILGGLSLYFFERYIDGDISATSKKAPPEKVASIKPIPPVKPPTLIPTPKLPPLKGRIAIVIDDLGASLSKIDSILNVDAPITVAVLPYLKHSIEVSERAYRGGRDVLLHAPMEPKNLKVHNPGDGALLTTMSDAEIRGMLKKNLKSVPHAIGVNNHMGSKFTEDNKKMGSVLKLLKERGIFFFDSRTTGASVAIKVAKGLGVPTVSRNVFLDNERDEKYIEGQLRELIKIAEKKGVAIAIGHPYPETIAVLERRLPGLRANGIKVVRLSELVK